MQGHRTVSREEWLEARRALLAKEKAHLRAHDELARLRRELPWVEVDKAYVFDGSDGKETLSDLFAGRSQLIVKHFMFGPDWKEGCVGCSFGADQLEGSLIHLVNHDVMLVAVSRAPYAEIAPFHKRMGWPFKWVSSNGNDFNYDFRVSFTPEEVTKGTIDYNFGTWPHAYEEWPGVSAFYKDDAGDVFHTYSTYGRGVEVMMHTYAMLDLMPKGRDERNVEYKMDWVRHHDRYESAPLSKTGSVDELHTSLKKQSCH